MQGRELDRNARPFVDPATSCGLAYGMNRQFVGAQITLRIVLGQRCLAQHVIGVAKAFCFALSGVAECFVDGLPGDELLSHHAHGQVDAFSDQGFASPADQTRQRLTQPFLRMRCHQFACHEQSPGGGVDKHRATLPQVGTPVSVSNLVADQGVTRGRVGDAKQRLRKTHQCDTLL
jgi:hypothetical protein